MTPDGTHDGTSRASPARDRAAATPLDPAARQRAFEALGRRIESCRKCRLGFLRSRAVVYRGGAAPRVLFVGEAPGAAEDREGRPFVGRSGRLLDAAVDQLGLAGDDVGVVNLLKCRPPENRFDREAWRACRPFLERQIELLQPRVLVSLGAWALRTLDPSAPRLLDAAGVARTGGDPPLFPLLHPAAAMRSRRWRERWTADVAALGRWLADRPR